MKFLYAFFLFFLTVKYAASANAASGVDADAPEASIPAALTERPMEGFAAMFLAAAQEPITHHYNMSQMVEVFFGTPPTPAQVRATTKSEAVAFRRSVSQVHPYSDDPGTVSAQALGMRLPFEVVDVLLPDEVRSVLPASVVVHLSDYALLEDSASADPVVLSRPGYPHCEATVAAKKDKAFPYDATVVFSTEKEGDKTILDKRWIFSSHARGLEGFVVSGADPHIAPLSKLQGRIVYHWAVPADGQVPVLGIHPVWTPEEFDVLALEGEGGAALTVADFFALNAANDGLSNEHRAFFRAVSERLGTGAAAGGGGGGSGGAPAGDDAEADEEEA